MEDAQALDTPNPPPLLLRIAVSLAVGLLVFGVAFQASRHTHGIRYDQSITVMNFGKIDEHIAKFRDRTRDLPMILDDLLPEGVKPVDSGYYIDGWDRPIIYERLSDDQYLLKSYGRDGLPGGLGLDYDLTWKNTYELESASVPTLKQFLLEVRGFNMIAISLGSGVLTVWLAWLLLRNATWSIAGTIEVLISLFLTTLATLVVGTILAVLHQPSGH